MSYASVNLFHLMQGNPSDVGEGVLKVEHLLKQGAQFNQMQFSGDGDWMEDVGTPLQEAAHKGYARWVEVLTHLNVSFVRGDANYGRTALETAAGHGSFEFLVAMEHLCPDFKQQLQESTDVLGACIEAGRADIFSWLVRMFAKYDVSRGFNDRSKGNPTPIAIAIQNNNVRMLECLLTAGVILPTHGDSALMLAASSTICDCADVVKKLLAMGEFVDGGFGVGDWARDGDTPLHWAARYGATQVATLLAEAGADVHRMNAMGETALFIAIGEHRYASEGRQVIWQTFLNLSLNAGFTDELRHRTINIAYAWSNKDVLLPLIKSRSNAAASMAFEDGETGLMKAIELGDREIFCMELEAARRLDPDAWLKHQNSKGETALLLACRGRRFGFARDLIAGGASLFDRDAFGTSVLMLSAKSGDIELCQRAFDAGLSVNTLNEQGKSPLMFAAFNGRVEIVKWLVSVGADVNLADERGRAALVHVIHRWDEKNFEVLLNAGANCNHQDICGRTPLMYAVRKHKVQAFNLLMEAQADVNLLDNSNRSALAHALWQRADDMSRRLLAHPLASDTDEELAQALQIARKRIAPELIDLIRSKAARKEALRAIAEINALPANSSSTMCSVT